MANNKTTDFRKYKRKWHMNIGSIVFCAIFIYLTVTVLMYLTKPKVTIYEVREGSILRDTAYTGLIIREEQIFKSDSNGYINFLTPEGSKVGAHSKIYALSENELKFKTNKEDTESLSSEEQEIMLIKTQSFSDNYNDGQFSDIYSLKADITSALESKSTQNKQSQIEEMKKTFGDSLQINYAKDDGIIVYSIDNYENISLDKITEDILNKKNYSKTNIAENSQVSIGSPVYKLITDDKWTIVINLNAETARELSENKTVKVRFIKDNQTARASFSIHKKGNLSLGILSFDSSMIRYIQERYLDIELILEDESGLKIPKSAVVKKEFYIVPEDYITHGGNSNDTGVLLKDTKNKVEFYPVSIYYRDYESGYVYLNPNEFDKNLILVQPDSSNTYQLGKTKNLHGVFNINKGYALFKQIQILCESEEYYIIEEGSDYSLSNYDHIALDGSSVKEDDIVFK